MVAAVNVLYDGRLEVQYRQFYVYGRDEHVQPEYGFKDQSNGLCGAKVPGILFLTTGLHTGAIGLRVELHHSEPVLEDKWEDVVEVSYESTSSGVHIKQWDGLKIPIDLPWGKYRVRYSGRGLDAASSADVVGVADPPIDHYLVQFWPSRESLEDRIVRQMSDQAAYWNRRRELGPNG